MAQHFLLSAKARTLSLRSIYQAGEDAAYATFRQIRWPETNGEPVGPRCGSLDHYDIPTRRKFKCAACQHQFSVTSGTTECPTETTSALSVASQPLAANDMRRELAGVCRAVWRGL